MDEDELRDQLRRFGLTEKEVDTYVAILGLGPSTAKEIAEAADVSKRHVYTIAEQLEKRRFVVIKDYVTPTIIQPAPPSTVSERLRDQTETFLQELQTRYQHGSGQLEDFEVLKSRSTIIDRIRTLVSAASDQIAISLPATLLADLRGELQAAVDHGVLVLLIVFGSPDALERVDESTAAGIAHVVRFRDIDIPIHLAVDRDSALVSPRGAITRPDNRTHSVFLGQSYLESVVFSSFMNTEWELGTEAYTVSPEQLPQSYTNFRYASIQAAQRVANDERIVTEVEARPVHTPAETERLSGEIVSVNQRLVEPCTGRLASLCSMDLLVDGERVSLGGEDAYLEDYGVYTITLRKRA